MGRSGGEHGAGSRRALAAAGVAFAVRLALILASDRVVADVAIYRKVAERVLAGAWNPYELPARFYPYPPVWVWFEAGAEWLARHTAVGFPVWVKLPVLAAEIGIVLILARWPGGGGGRAAAWAPWLYALHPVALIVSGVHGQFDSLPLFFTLLALRLHERGRLDASALALAGGIAVKSFPVLLLPFFAARLPSLGRAARFCLLATVPVGLLLVPFAAANLPALVRELFGYSGFADFGWIGFYRGLLWLDSGTLARSEPPYWGVLPGVAKLLFLAVYGTLLLAFWRRRLGWSLAEATLAVFLAFQALYGSVSAQYLLWVVPFAVLRPDGFVPAHAVAGTGALLAFYSFLHPRVLFADPSLAPAGAGAAWVAGVGAVLLVGVAWLVFLVRRGLLEAQRVAEPGPP